jgi:hypothetical protein
MPNRKPPIDRVQGPGKLIVAITREYTHVSLQFFDPDWWIHFTPEEARAVAALLVKKADDIDTTQRDQADN